MEYKVNDQGLNASVFIPFVNKVWPGDYDEEKTQSALSKTLNISAYENNVLVGCLRILSDGYFFGTITELLVLPEYQKRGIGSKLLDYGTARLEGYPAYLEASTYDSARLYERRGFLSLGPLGGIFPKAHAVGMVYPAIGPAEVVARAAGQA